MGAAVGKQGKCDFAECRCEASAACPSCCLAAGENRTECTVGARLGCFAAEKGGAPLLPLPHEGTDHSPSMPFAHQQTLHQPPLHVNAHIINI